MVVKIIKRKIEALTYNINLIKLKLFSKFKKATGTQKYFDGDLLIVSLTTYHKRLSVVHLTIESLLNQKVKPNKIILWLSNDDLKEGVPDNISRLASRGLDIRVVDENIRSYKKLIYTLREYPKALIITCDDDVIYPPNFVEGLYKKHVDYPSHIIAYRCTLMTMSSHNILAPYNEWPIAVDNDASYDLFPTGVGGILYPPDSLMESVFDKDLFLTLAPQGDDIWFKAMALKNNTKTIMVNNTTTHFPPVKGSQDDALWHTNVLNNENDKQLKKVFDYFNLYNFINNSN